MAKTVLVAGASGLVGSACIRRLASEPGTRIIAISRRRPSEPDGVEFRHVDLTDGDAAAAFVRDLPEVTHLVYAALYEKPQLLAGWVDGEQIATNAAMFRNLLGPFADRTGLRHVSILQGTKAYGIHVRSIPIPAREDRDEAYDVPNFYWEQEGYLKERAAGGRFAWNIFRPQAVLGESLGAAMNAIVAIGAYAAILRETGEPLHYPGADPQVMEATDVDILARAIAWAGETEAAHNQAFNVTNGDVFRWQEVWPAIADALGMRPGEARPMSLAEEMPKRAPEWDAIRARYGLDAPPLMPFVGLSFQFFDSLVGSGDPSRATPGIVSTVKIRQAGFTDTIDTEAMFRKWFRRLQDKRLLPASWGGDR
jgi:nucleoside-diphosphate-sugar epimerase